MSYRKRHIKHNIHRTTPKQSLLVRPLFWLSMLALVLAGSAGYVVLFYSGFQITDISVHGAKTINGEYLRQLSQSDVDKGLFSVAGITSKSILLFDATRVADEIKRDQSISGIIEDVQVQKRFPHSLEVTVTERLPAARYCQEESCWALDGKGIIFTDSADRGGFIVRQDITLEGLADGATVLEPLTVQGMLEISSRLESAGVQVSAMLLQNPYRLNVATTEGWQIYFDLNPHENASFQLEKAVLLLNGELTAEKRGGLEYVDLRFKDRAFFK